MTSSHQNDARFIKGKAAPSYLPSPRRVAAGKRMAAKYSIGEMDLARYLDRNDGANLRHLRVPPAVLERVLRRVMSTMENIFSSAELQRYLDWHQYKAGPGKRCIALGKRLERKLLALSCIQRAAMENVLVSIWHGDPLRDISLALFQYRSRLTLAA